MITLVQCEDCTRCKVKYWWVHCDKQLWQWEMLKGSKLTQLERKERPLIDIPKILNNNACSCGFYDEMDKENK